MDRVKSAINRQLIKEASRNAIFSKLDNVGSKVDDIGRKVDGLSNNESKLTLPKMVGTLVAALGVNQFVKRMIAYGEQKRLEAQEPAYYEKMIEKNPKLMEEDPQEVMDIWNTLFHNSPHLAKDPIAAGAFITQQVQARYREDIGGPTIDTYETLNSIENKGYGAKQKRFGSDEDLTGLIATSTQSALGGG